MPILEARIQTERASRYLVQFCKHAAAMGDGGHSPRMHLQAAMAQRDVQVKAEWSDSYGTVSFTPWGRCTIAAAADTLTVHIESADEDGLRQIQDIITRDLERFSRRQPLTVIWHREQPSGEPSPPVDAEDEPMPRRPRRTVAGWVRANLVTVVVAIAVLLAVGLHLGLAGTIIAQSRWTGVAMNVVLVIAALKVAFVIVVRLVLRHRSGPGQPDGTSTGRRA